MGPFIFTTLLIFYFALAHAQQCSWASGPGSCGDTDLCPNNCQPDSDLPCVCQVGDACAPSGSEQPIDGAEQYATGLGPCTGAESVSLSFASDMQDPILCPGEGQNLEVYWGDGPNELLSNVVKGVVSSDVVTAVPAAGATTINFVNQHQTCGINLWFAICCQIPTPPPTTTTWAATTTAAASTSSLATSTASTSTLLTSSLAAAVASTSTASTSGSPPPGTGFTWPWWLTLTIIASATFIFVLAFAAWWFITRRPQYETINS